MQHFRDVPYSVPGSLAFHNSATFWQPDADRGPYELAFRFLHALVSKLAVMVVEFTLRLRSESMESVWDDGFLFRRFSLRICCAWRGLARCWLSRARVKCEDDEDRRQLHGSLFRNVKNECVQLLLLLLGLIR